MSTDIRPIAPPDELSLGEAEREGALAAELPGAGTIVEAMVLDGMSLAIGGVWTRRKRGRDGDY